MRNYVDMQRITQLLRKKARRLTYALGVLVAAALTTLWVVHAGQAAAIVPGRFIKEVSFPVYAPAYLPASYTIDQKSFFINNDNVLEFQALGNKASIVVTEEATPHGFNFASFYNDNLTSVKTFGDLQYRPVSGYSTTTSRQIISINTGSTWILLTSNANLSNTTLREIAQHMQRQ